MGTILILTGEFPPFRGGIATYTKPMALAAHKAGHVVTVCAPYYSHDVDSRGPDHFPFHVQRYPPIAFQKKNLPRLLWRVWRQNRLRRHDVIHAIDYPHFVALGLINAIKKVKFIATVHGTEIFLLSKYSNKPGMERVVLSPRRITANSEFTKTLFLSKFPYFPTDRILATLLGADSFWFGDAGDVNSVRSRYGVPRDHFVVLTVARLDVRKGHELVLNALNRLPESLKARITYLIVGEPYDTRYLDHLKIIASKLALRVVFGSTVSDEELRRIYRAADVFCMPGVPHPERVEGFGLVYLEAVAQGLPSIACRLGGIPEVISDVRPERQSGTHGSTRGNADGHNFRRRVADGNSGFWAEPRWTTRKGALCNIISEMLYPYRKPRTRCAELGVWLYSLVWFYLWHYSFHMDSL